MDTTADRIAQGETEEQARDEAPLPCYDCGAEYKPHPMSTSYYAEHKADCSISGDEYGNRTYIRHGKVAQHNALARTLRRAATLEAENEKLQVRIEDDGRTLQYYKNQLERTTTQLAEERKRREALEKGIKRVMAAIGNSVRPTPEALQIGEMLAAFFNSKEPA